MWPADSLLLVVAGNDYVDAGIWRRQGWKKGGVVRLSLGRAGDLAALDEALTTLAGQAATLLGCQEGKPRGRLGQVRVLLSDAWFEGVLLPWHPLATAGAALEGFARSSLLDAGVALAGGEIIRVADTPYGRPRWAVAYPGELIRCLQGFAQAMGAPLASVAPLGIAACHALRGQGTETPPLAVVDRRSLSLWRRSEGLFQLLLKEESPSDAASPWNEHLDCLCRRVRIRGSASPASDRVAVLHLDAPQSVAAPMPLPYEQVEFPASVAAEDVPRGLQVAALARNIVLDVDALQRRPRRSIPILTAACFVVGLALAMTFDALRGSDTESGIREELLAKTATAVRKPAPAWSKSELQKVQAVNGAIRELNLPVSTLLRAVEPPKDIRVALLGIEFAPGRGGNETPLLKLTAEARTGEEMARYTAFLAGRPPLVEVYLVSHEVADTDSLKTYRFTVEAKWQD